MVELCLSTKSWRAICCRPSALEWYVRTVGLAPKQVPQHMQCQRGIHREVQIPCHPPTVYPQPVILLCVARQGTLPAGLRRPEKVCELVQQHLCIYGLVQLNESSSPRHPHIQKVLQSTHVSHNFCFYKTPSSPQAHTQGYHMLCWCHRRIL